MYLDRRGYKCGIGYLLAPFAREGDCRLVVLAISGSAGCRARSDPMSMAINVTLWSGRGKGNSRVERYDFWYTTFLVVL